MVTADGGAGEKSARTIASLQRNDERGSQTSRSSVFLDVSRPRPRLLPPHRRIQIQSGAEGTRSVAYGKDSATCNSASSAMNQLLHDPHERAGQADPESRCSSNPSGVTAAAANPAGTFSRGEIGESR